MSRRTTVRLDPHLLAEVKKLAAATHRTLTSLLEESLRETLARRRRRGRVTPTLTIVDGRGVRPGVDLDDSSALLDVMDGRDGSA